MLKLAIRAIGYLTLCVITSTSIGLGLQTPSISSSFIILVVVVVVIIIIILISHQSSVISHHHHQSSSSSVIIIMTTLILILVNILLLIIIVMLLLIIISTGPSVSLPPFLSTNPKPKTNHHQQRNQTYAHQRGPIRNVRTPSELCKGHQICDSIQ